MRARDSVRAKDGRGPAPTLRATIPPAHSKGQMGGGLGGRCLSADPFAIPPSGVVAVREYGSSPRQRPRSVSTEIHRPPKRCLALTRALARKRARKELRDGVADAGTSRAGQVTDSVRNELPYAMSRASRVSEKEALMLHDGEPSSRPRGPFGNSSPAGSPALPALPPLPARHNHITNFSQYFPTSTPCEP